MNSEPKNNSRKFIIGVIIAALALGMVYFVTEWHNYKVGFDVSKIMGVYFKDGRHIAVYDDGKMFLTDMDGLYKEGKYVKTEAPNVYKISLKDDKGSKGTWSGGDYISFTSSNAYILYPGGKTVKYPKTQDEPMIIKNSNDSNKSEGND